MLRCRRLFRQHNYDGRVFNRVEQWHSTSRSWWMNGGFLQIDILAMVAIFPLVCSHSSAVSFFNHVVCKRGGDSKCTPLYLLPLLQWIDTDEIFQFWSTCQILNISGIYFDFNKRKLLRENFRRFTVIFNLSWPWISGFRPQPYSGNTAFKV